MIVSQSFGHFTMAMVKPIVSNYRNRTSGQSTLMGLQTLAKLRGFLLGKGDAPIKFETPRLDNGHAIGVTGNFEVFRVFRVNLRLLGIMVVLPGMIGSEDFHKKLMSCD